MKIISVTFLQYMSFPTFSLLNENIALDFKSGSQKNKTDEKIYLLFTQKERSFRDYKVTSMTLST